MRNRGRKGFTLIELLIVIAIIGILAAVLIPNLLNARARAFDTAAQTCLKEIGTAEEVEASVDPWQYSDGDFAGTPDEDTGLNSNEILSCQRVVVVSAPADFPEGETGTSGLDNYGYTARHDNGTTTFRIDSGSGVVVD